MQSRSIRRSGQPTRARASRMRLIDRDLIRGRHYGQRSCEPHTKAEHMAAPTNAALVKKVLANSEPSTHGLTTDGKLTADRRFRSKADIPAIGSRCAYTVLVNLPRTSGKIEGSPATFPRAMAGTPPIEQRQLGDSWRQRGQFRLAFQCALPLMEGATWCGAAPGAACGVPTLWLDGGGEPAHHR